MGGLVLLIIGAIMTVAGFGGFVYTFRVMSKPKEELVLTWKSKITLAHIIGTALMAVGLTLVYSGVIIWQKLPSLPGYQAMTILSGLLLGLSFGTFVGSLLIFYFFPNPSEKVIKLTRLLAIFGGLATLGFIFMSLDGFTYLDAISYPLVNKIPFGEDKGIAFYALFIISGALTTWFIVEQYYFRKYGKKGLIENLFYVGFLVGVLGARIWFVVGDWNVRFASNPIDAFKIWEGGLTIIGGLLFGGLAGITFWATKRKEYPRAEILDVVLPAVLIAQAIGRWGNFFNQEVYGAATEVWTFLPKFIQNQMIIYSRIDGLTSFRVPLFLIESLINIAGYFVIRYAIGRGLKKWTLPGDQGFAYFLWYGVTRAIMEPLRNPDYNMGTTGKWSSIQAYIWIGFALIAIIANHLVEHFAHDKWYKVMVAPNYGRPVKTEATIAIKEEVDEEKVEVENNSEENTCNEEENKHE